LPYCPHIQNFQHHFSALILFGDNWGAEIARTSCASLFPFKQGMDQGVEKAFDRTFDKQIIFAPVTVIHPLMIWQNH